MSKEEPNIILMCRKGEKGADKSLFSIFLPFVMGICRRYAVTNADADDLVKDTFIKVFNKIDQYDPNRGSQKNWISRICVNTCLVYLRHARDFELLDEVNGEEIYEFNPPLNDIDSDRLCLVN